MLVGNKSDLAHQRVVRTEDGKNFAQSMDIGFIETSALNGSNIIEAHMQLVNTIYKVLCQKI